MAVTTIKMYKVTNYYFTKPEIYEVEVDRTTESSVWIDGNRRNRYSNHDNYYETFKEAKKALLARYKRRINKLLRDFEYNKDKLEQVQAIETAVKER